MLSLLENRSSPAKLCWPFVLNIESDQADGLVGWWPGGPSGGMKLFDRSGNNNHGTLTNFASPFTSTSGWVAGKDGGGKSALSYDGTDDYVTVGDVAACRLTTKGSVSCWVKIRSTTGYNFLAGKEQFSLDLNGYSLFTDTSSRWRCEVCGSATRSSVTPATPTVTLNVWHHLMMTWDTVAGLTLYLDGKSIGLIASTTVVDAGYPVEFGWNSNYAPCKTNGAIEDVKIHNRCLTAAEADSFYNPATRWQLRYRLGRTKWFLGSSSVTPPPATNVAFLTMGRGADNTSGIFIGNA